MFVFMYVTKRSETVDRFASDIHMRCWVPSPTIPFLHAFVYVFLLNKRLLKFICLLING